MLKEDLILAKSEFELLKAKVLRNEILTESEAKSFCGLLSATPYNVNENIDKYPCCNSYKFWTLYLTYHKNLAGGIRYYKYDALKVQREIKTLADAENFEPENFFYEVSADEAERDLNYLYSIADEWETVTKKLNHKDELLFEASKEARNDLKDFEEKKI